MSISEKISHFPKKPGVYLFKDSKGNIIYIGKAKHLKKRVQSYFKTSLPGRQKTAGDIRSKVDFLLRRAKDIDFIVTDSEKEALLLENTLIKKHRPRYNIQLRDDKTYVSIRVGLNHSFPGISIVRRTLKDGASYFGPFVSASAARETVDQIIRSFRIRTCCDREFANRIRPCLEFDLGRCSAPCTKKITEKNYAECIEEALLFLKGSKQELIKKLEYKMKMSAASMRYEDASRFRDAISRIKETLARQKVVVHGGRDYDVIALNREGDQVACCILKIRGGTLMDRRLHAKSASHENDSQIIESLIIGHYVEGPDIPQAIFTSINPEDLKDIISILEERAGRKVRVLVPKRGIMLEMMELAAKNAREVMIARKSQGEEMVKRLLGLQKKLKLPKIPEVIECIDISNLIGREAYGSLVTFVYGKPEKSRYRLYSIKTLTTPDDYGMMKEVLTRRFNSSLSEPDLLLIDGGKGQLNIATKVLKDLNIVDVPIAAIAKPQNKGPDRIFLAGRKDPVAFKPQSAELLFLSRIRDEAHRFGIKAHRKKHVKATFK